MSKTLTIDEIFCGMPRLKIYFKDLDRKIRIFTPSAGECEEVEKIKKKRRELLKTAKAIDCIDLQILYYLHNLHRIRAQALLLSLKKIFFAEEELDELLKKAKP